MKKSAIILSLILSSLGYAQVNDTGDKVGIGVLAPAEKLHVNGNIFANMGEGFKIYGDINYFGTWQDGIVFQMEDSNSTGGGTDGGFVFRGYTPTDDIFRDWMVIRSPGNVGIGTTTPAARLDVEDGDIYVGEEVAANGKRRQVRIYGYDNNAKFYGSLHANYDDSKRTFDISTNSEVNQIKIDASANTLADIILNPGATGKVGIGTTTPSSALDIKAISYGINQEGGVNLSAFRNDVNMWTTQVGMKSTETGSPRFAITTKQRDISNTETRNIEAISIPLSNGRVGIGIETPEQKLHVAGNIKTEAASSAISIVGTGTGDYNGGNLILSALGVNTGNEYASSWVMTHRGTDGNASFGIQRRNLTGNYKGTLLYYKDGLGWSFRTAGNHTSATVTEKLIIRADGDVGIGTDDTKGYKLAVKGKIITEEVKVALYTNWSDFVFKSNYNLPTLQEVETHIKEKGHLKDIPSAEEVAKNGFYLGEMDAKLLQKIEELTLYTIQQEKRIKALEQENNDYKSQANSIKQLKAQMALLLKTIEKD